MCVCVKYSRMRSSFIPPHAIDTPLVQRQLVLFPSVLASGPAGRRTLCGRFWSTGFLDIWWPHTVSMIDVDVRAENTARKGPKRGAEKRCTTATLSFYSFFLLDLLWNVFFFTIIHEFAFSPLVTLLSFSLSPFLSIIVYVDYEKMK